MATDTSVLIIGGGLAGATLAWQLRDRGWRPRVIDSATPGRATTVAAGLITPVTGKKLKPEPNFASLLATANAHYRDVASNSKREFLAVRPAIRRLDTAQAQAAWRPADTSLRALAQPYETPPVLRNAANFPVIRMPDAARLDTSRYLQAVKQRLGEDWIEANVQDTAIACDTDEVQIPALGLSGRFAVFSRGWRDHDNSWFSELSWRPAKGQLIRISAPALNLGATTLHGNGLWLTAEENDTYLAGATYSWDNFEEGPTNSDTQQLIEKLGSLINSSFSLLDAQVGVRPIVAGRKPVIGVSHRHPRVWLLNGLGSKGSLYAPTVAKHLIAAMLDQQPIPEMFDLSVRTAT
ncbi:MAG: FAD-dependent oxidoreductase [Pseudomonadota bacterium]